MKQYRYLLSSLDKIVDYIINFAIAYFCYWVAVVAYQPEFETLSMRAFFIVSVLCLAGSFLYDFHNVYRPMRTQRTFYYAARIFFVNMEIIGLSSVIIFLLARENNVFYIAWLVLSCVISFAVLVCKKIILISVLHSLRSTSRNVKHILLITDSQEKVDDYMEELADNPQFGYSVIGYVGNLNIIGLPHLGTTGDLDRVLKETKPDEVILAFDTIRKKLISRYITVCNDNCVRILMLPSICGYFKSPNQVMMVGSLPMIDLQSNPMDKTSSIVAKRILDVVGSVILIILTSPLMLIAAIGVKLSSPGPILFRQTRVGKNNKEFTIYKFRSMTVNEQEQTGWSAEDDPRITRFGAFIRKFAIDELPQFFNVLKGDMSLVGPRPEVPFYVEKFRKEIPLYMLKHTLRPGITGLAQIKGLRGDTSIQARIEEDLNYIENWTFWGDIRILLVTPFRAINRHEKFAKREAIELQKKEQKGNRDLPDEGHDDESSPE